VSLAISESAAPLRRVIARGPVLAVEDADGSRWRSVEGRLAGRYARLDAARMLAGRADHRRVLLRLAPERQVFAVPGIGEVEPGSDLAAEILSAIRADGRELLDGDIVVITQKVVSKAEGCVIELDTVEPSVLANEWAELWDKDPRVVEIVLRQSRRIVRMHRGIIISETHHGLVCANAGVDQSNVGGERVTLLPTDPDASAAELRAALEAGSGAGVRLGVVISDTFGRAWREGQTNVAIGVSGVEALRHFEGQVDPTGYELRVTMLATADELAAAAELVMGKVDRVPVAVVRGLARALGEGSAQELIRPAANDLFR
jgi:coenzyme F420-0:L-glutamate ligase/coenzyme F420-1:gamma-L-glutamate ligase